MGPGGGAAAAARDDPSAAALAGGPPSSLPAALLEAVAAVQPNIILVLQNGGPIAGAHRHLQTMLRWVVPSHRRAAVLQWIGAWRPPRSGQSSTRFSPASSGVMRYAICSPALRFPPASCPVSAATG